MNDYHGLPAGRLENDLIAVDYLTEAGLIRFRGGLAELTAAGRTAALDCSSLARRLA